MTTSSASHTFQIEQTARLVLAYVSRNRLPATDLPMLIRTVHEAVGAIQAPHVPVASDWVRPTAAEIEASVHQAGLVSFVDGKTYKALRRHLSGHGLTPERYRSRYGLPDDYPMVAADYSARRSAIARQIQFGVAAA